MRVTSPETAAERSPIAPLKYSPSSGFFEYQSQSSMPRAGLHIGSPVFIASYIFPHGSPMPRGCFSNGEIPYRAGDAGAQRISQRREPKAPLLVQREDTDARKHAHEAEEGLWISTYSTRDFTTCFRAVRKLIGDPKPRRGSDSLAYPIAAYVIRAFVLGSGSSFVLLHLKISWLCALSALAQVCSRRTAGLQLRRAISIQAEGKKLLEKHAIAPSAARLCWASAI